MAGRRLPRAPLETPNPSGSWEEGESEGEEGVADPEKDSPLLAALGLHLRGCVCVRGRTFWGHLECFVSFFFGIVF